MTQKEKLTWMLSLLMDPQNAFVPTTAADYLLEHGVVVLPCRCKECECYIHPWESDDGQIYGLCDIHGTANLKNTEFCSKAKRKRGDH